MKVHEKKYFIVMLPALIIGITLIYGIRENQYPLVHELTHTLLGYGDNFGTNRGYLTQEGFAVYMEDKYGKQKQYSHQIMKHLIDINKTISINKLVDLNQDDSYFRPGLINPEDYTIQWISYIHAASFVTYLIESYGLEKFEQIYNKEDLAKKIGDIYEKNISEIKLGGERSEYKRESNGCNPRIFGVR